MCFNFFPLLSPLLNPQSMTLFVKILQSKPYGEAQYILVKIVKQGCISNGHILQSGTG